MEVCTLGTQWCPCAQGLSIWVLWKCKKCVSRHVEVITVVKVLQCTSVLLTVLTKDFQADYTSQLMFLKESRMHDTSIQKLYWTDLPYAYCDRHDQMLEVKCWVDKSVWVTHELNVRQWLEVVMGHGVLAAYPKVKPVSKSHHQSFKSSLILGSDARGKR